MTFYEKQQSQNQWQHRLEQERRNISVSVEEAMIVEADDEWNEIDEEDVSGEKQNGVQTSGKNTALIPPRLSLQSKMLPALRSESFVQSATAAHAAFQQAEAREKQQSKKQASSQTNIFVRLAQRFTSSFAAVNVSPAGQVLTPISPTVPPASSPQNPAIPHARQEHPSNVSEKHMIHVPASPLAREVYNHVSPPTKIIDAIPATPSTRPSVVPQQTGPQRLAGYSTKVRLKVAPHPQTAPLPAEQGSSTVHESRERNSDGSCLYDEQEALREPLEIQLNVPDITKVSTRPDLIAVPLSLKKGHEQALKEQPAPSPMPTLMSTHQTFFGSSAFEAGQAEVMVALEQVQLSSVVHVTLTSNPGQTLIQYVSLHPDVGFTVHLTAPASSKTSFNYALLVQPQDVQATL